MKRFKNILLVYNIDTKQNLAVERAVSLAEQNEARLTVLAVVKEPPTNMLIRAITIMPTQELFELAINDSRAKVDALVSTMTRQGVNAKSRVMTGTPFIEIIRLVLRDKHDLVIVLAEGKGGIKERLFGSTSMHLMRKCPCPVWVVKPAKHAKYERIMAAVDTTVDLPNPERESLNLLIIQLASSLARMDNSEFHVIQVWSIYGEGYIEVRGGLSEKSIRNWRKETKQQFQAQLDRLLSDVNLKEVIPRRHLLKNDDAPKTIVRLAKSKKIDLLVMGTVCRTGLAGFFIGNTAEKVLSEVNCSVLTVKPKDFVTPVTLENE